jgi:hypothetical protein
LQGTIACSGQAPYTMISFSLHVHPRLSFLVSYYKLSVPPLAAEDQKPFILRASKLMSDSDMSSTSPNIPSDSVPSTILTLDPTGSEAGHAGRPPSLHGTYHAQYSQSSQNLYFVRTLSSRLEGEDVTEPDFDEGEPQTMTAAAAMIPAAPPSQQQPTQSAPNLPTTTLQPTRAPIALPKASAAPTAPPAQVWTSSGNQHTHCERIHCPQHLCWPCRRICHVLVDLGTKGKS